MTAAFWDGVAKLCARFMTPGIRAATPALALLATSPAALAETAPTPSWRLHARIVAVGLPGVAGVRQVGRFHSGGPIPGNPDFLLSTAPGEVLDPRRLLVALASNFGLPLGEPSYAAGSVLSIDPDANSAGALIVPADFAASGDTAAGAAIRLYTAQSRAFQNRRYNAGARTADHTAASAPRYLSINNAFGRPWIASAPQGLRGRGTVSVVDPDGAPLDNAPSGEAGGVFAGEATNRQYAPTRTVADWLSWLLGYRATGQLTAGALSAGALGTAFLGASPDGSGFAVFAVVTADGALAQVHVQDGVDGLAPAGTVTPVEDGAGVIGIAFKWNPDRVIYLVDRGRDRLVLLHLDDDGRHFRVTRTDFVKTPELSRPVDLAAAVPEIANPRFASHTTLAGGSDLYVANGGDGSLLRLSQDGQVLARAEIEVPGLGRLGSERIRAIAVSAEADRIWLSPEGELPGFPGYSGALIEVSAFDAGGAFERSPDEIVTAGTDLAGEGGVAFVRQFGRAEGLGPLFNARSCVTCHPGGGQSSLDLHFVRRIAVMDPVTGRVVLLDHPNSPVARRFSLEGSASDEGRPADLPRSTNVVSLRMPLSLHASGRLDEIPDSVIEAQAVGKGDGIHGRPHYVTGSSGEQRVGRYGWKANIAALDEMVADAFANEIGIVAELAPAPPVGPRFPAEDDGGLARSVAAYLRSLKLPSERSR